MAKKELLFFIIVICVAYWFFSIATSENTLASSPNITMETEDLEFVKTIATEGYKAGIGAIKDKWYELQAMVRSSMGTAALSMGEVNLELDNFEDRNTTLKVFVSSSMNISLLKSYAEMAKRYGAVLVLNGLPEGSWRKLSNLIYELNGKGAEDISIQIDDTAFEEYGITRVPSIVLVKEQNLFDEDNAGEDRYGEKNNVIKASAFDKITGNIGIRRALEAFAEKGDLKQEAAEILSKAGDK